MRALPLLPQFKGFGTERARLVTKKRGFGTERARLVTKKRGFGTERARLDTFRGFGTGLRAFWHFLKNLKKWSFFYSKRAPSPAKTEVLHEKSFLFLLKKTSQPRKKLKFCMKKWQKNDKKRYQKEHPAPQNLIFCMKKKFFFYSKIPPTLAKNKSFEWKKIYFFSFYFSFDFFLFIFLLIFFSWSKKNWDSFYNRSKKNEVLHEKFKIVLPMGILKKKISTPNFTKFLNP